MFGRMALSPTPGRRSTTRLVTLMALGVLAGVTGGQRCGDRGAGAVRARADHTLRRKRCSGDLCVGVRRRLARPFGIVARAQPDRHDPHPADAGRRHPGRDAGDSRRRLGRPVPVLPVGRGPPDRAPARGRRGRQGRRDGRRDGERSVGWVGAIFVDVGAAASGLGTAISGGRRGGTRACRLHDAALIATDEGRPIYERLGFVQQTRYVRAVAQKGCRPRSTRWSGGWSRATSTPSTPLTARRPARTGR